MTMMPPDSKMHMKMGTEEPLDAVQRPASSNILVGWSAPRLSVTPRDDMVNPAKICLLLQREQIVYGDLEIVYHWRGSQWYSSVV